MVTEKKSEYATADTMYKEIFCLSSDTKPTDVANGSLAIEIDTGKEFRFDAENETWYDQHPAPEAQGE